MKRKNTGRTKSTPHLQYKMAELIEIPQESITRDSSVFVIGNRRAEINGCCGVLEYSDTRIVLRARSGIIEILGIDMEICSLLKDQITVRGSVSELHFVEETGGLS